MYNILIHNIIIFYLPILFIITFFNRKEVGLTTYNEGDCIFAQMRGYKYWPARVIQY